MVELARRHPLSSIEPELAFRNNASVTITAEPFVAMVNVRLRETVNAVSGVRLPNAVDTWVPNGTTGRAIWLGPDEWLVTSTALAPQQLEDELRAAVPLGGVAIDVSAQRVGLRLNGFRIREVLAKVCSFDLHPRVFRPGRAVQTTVGLAGVILLALSPSGDDFLLLVRSSFATYLAEWLLDAAEEFTVPAQLGATTAAAITAAPISTQE